MKARSTYFSGLGRLWAPKRLWAAPENASLHFTLLLFVITLLAAGVRLLRLDWQPLWWDEGYSVYFATEPLARMAWLTARDIHPPLYFALAHGWVTLFDSYRPETFRLLSVVCALPAIPLLALLARHLWPQSQNLALGAAALLALNPMHLFYSQEVRMYGLALTLTLTATLLFVIYTRQQITNDPGHNFLTRRAGLLYALIATLALYTLYYAALLLLAHALWLLYLTRQVRHQTPGRPGRPIGWFAPFLWVALLYVPWIAFAVPQLLPYIQDKVAADQDLPLGLLAYLWMHWVAFTGGHLPAAARWLDLARYAGLLAPLILIALWRFRPRHAASSEPNHLGDHSRARSDHPSRMLAFFLLIPLALGYLINLVYPFFPQGGERLLFMVLPYFLLLMLGQIFAATSARPIAKRLATIAMVFLLISAATGAVIFFSMSRYVNEDYRPLIRAVIAAGRENDTVLAIFPWQIGYWRAYSPQEAGQLVEPQPPPLDQEALVWNDAVRNRIDAALAQGTIWFPAPLGFGTSLPHEIETYLINVAANVSDVWYSPTTRLSAWTQKADTTASVHSGPDFVFEPQAIGPALLENVHLDTHTVEAANHPLPLRFHWGEQVNSTPMRVGLQLRAMPHPETGEQRVWVERSYEPLGRYAQSSPVPAGQTDGTAGTDGMVEDVALLIPAGLPPGEYELAIAVTEMSTPESTAPEAPPPEATSPEATSPETTGTGPANWQTADIQNTANIEYIAIAPLHIESAAERLSPVRLPIDATATSLWATTWLDIWPWRAWKTPATVEAGGLRLLGVSGAPTSAPVLAGTEIELRLQLAVLESHQTAEAQNIELVLELRAADGRAQAQSVAWPLAQPSATSHSGSLLSAPLSLFLPGYLAAGDGYTLWAGIETGNERRLMPVGALAIDRRTHNFEAPARMSVHFETPYQFGTHVHLLGYDLAGTTDTPTTGQTTLQLHWQVLEPIYPPHHIFVHLVDAAGELLQQHDGEPRLVNDSAPTGSWVPQEYLTTVHTFTHRPPANSTLAELLASGSITANVGLYNPKTETRLPVSQGGEVSGDYASLDLNP